MVGDAPVGLVARTRLLDLLDQAPDHALVLVCAPPGFGKTSLLVDWARHRARSTPAWLTLDEDDNDPRRLWCAVLAAMSGCPAVPDDSALRRLPADPPVSVPELAGEIVDALDELPEPVRLVLDNVDELVAPAAQDVLRVLIRHRPRGLRLVLSSRLDPPLSLPRLRLEGRLHEIRVDQLRFTPGEARKLLETAGTHLDEPQITALHGLTGGWAAALRLAAISLRSTPDPDAFLAAFSGDDRSVAEYLVNEILSGLSSEIRDFLSATSVCDAIPPDLAADLSGRQDAADLLDRLEREMSVVDPVNARRSLYRMQPLVRTYLRADLERGQPARASGLHARAAAWWAAHDDPVQALAHVTAAGNRPLIATLLRRFALRFVVSGAHQLVRQALDLIAEEERTRDPWLALCSALCHLEWSELPEAEAYLNHVERHWPDETTPELDVLYDAARSFHTCQSGRPPVERPARPEPAAPVAEPATAALTGVVAAVHQLTAPQDQAAARRGLADTLRLAGEHGLDHLVMQCRTLQAAHAAVTGDYRLMSTAGNAALSSAAANGWHRSVWAYSAHAMLAYAALLRAEPVEAQRHAVQGLRIDGVAISPAARLALRSVHGCSVFDRGHRAAGFDEMVRARTDVADLPLTAEQAAGTALLECRAALALGRLEAAARVGDWLVDRTGAYGEAALMKAWGEIGLGRPEAGRALLAPVLAGDVPHLLPSTPVEAQLADAECALEVGDRAAALRAVKTALDLGTLLDLVRPFVLAGPAIRAVLQAWTEGPDDVHELVGRALGAQALQHPQTTLQLSEREQAVLILLPSLLSLEEIAEDLSISLNTVKSHLRAIYLKLGANSRHAAVVAAHDRELLTTGPYHRALRD
jgi:LuxR family maltose regulon positive regulatory protein